MDGLLYLNSLPIFDSNNNTPDVTDDGCAATTGSSKENTEREAEAAPAADSGASKYSLRPRTQRRQRSLEDSTEDEDGKCSGDASPSGEGGGGVARRRGGGGRRARRRQPQPLSRYRRRTANARERERMREINAAFEALRRALPPLAAASAPESEDEDATEEQQRGGEKVTKVATLRLAIRYITELTRALETVSCSPPPQPPPQQELFPAPYPTLQGHHQQNQQQHQHQLQLEAAEAAPQLGVAAAVALPPVSTLILPPGAFFSGDTASGCEQLLTPPPSLTPSSSLGADCVAPALDDAWPPPDLCLTPPPLLDDAFLSHR